MLRIPRRVMAVLALAGAAGCGDGVSGPDDMRLQLSPEALSLYAGEQTPVAAQVVRGDGRLVEFAAVQYWSEHPSIANVTPAGVVAGVVPGSTHIVAGYGTLRARVAVSVLRDDRDAVRQLDLAAAEISANARNPEPAVVELVARDGYGNSVCHQAPLSFRSDSLVAVARNGSTGPASCRILIQPYGRGQTYVVASADGVSDSVLVTVTSTEYRVHFTHNLDEITVGSEVQVAAILADGAGTPLREHPVVFEVTVGSLNAYRVATDSLGQVAVTWKLPTRLVPGAQDQSVRLRTQLPDGSVRTITDAFWLFTGPVARLEFYRLSFHGWTLLEGTVHFRWGESLEMYVVGRDIYGNLTTASPVLESLDDPLPYWLTVKSGLSHTTGEVLFGFPGYLISYLYVSGSLYFDGTLHLRARTFEGAEKELNMVITR